MTARNTLTFLIALLLTPFISNALTLDEFLVEGVASSSVNGIADTKVITANGVVGGRRTIFAVKTSFGAGVTRLETFADAEFSGDPDFSLGYTQGAHTGQGIVTWDGDDQGSTLTANGLGSLDLAQDGGTAIVLGLKFFDFPANQPIDLTIRLYDSSNSAALKYSDVTVTLNQGVNSQPAFDLVIPFERFINTGSATIAAPGGATFATTTIFGPGGGINITKVGAIQLILNGLQNSSAPDLTIDYIKTNGRCSSVPNSQGKVLDDCGVCLEQSNANSGRDICGICLFGPPGYSYTPVTDSCGLCPNAINYQKAKDPCGVCFGDGSTCADCNGVPNGGAQVDVCGICGGNGNSCRDCQGTPFGSAALDICGVCSGNGTSCLDCAGTPFGPAKADACGTCNGSISDPNSCGSNGTNCVTVAATKEVLGFQKRLETKAKLIYKRYQDELARSSRNRCGINTKRTSLRVISAYRQIIKRGKEIFTSGVEVCGDSCVTVSYAEEVQALNPQFKILERETLRLANQVKSCYARLRINRKGGSNGVASTLRDVRSGLNQLVEDCKARKVCPN